MDSLREKLKEIQRKAEAKEADKKRKAEDNATKTAKKPRGRAKPAPAFDPSKQRTLFGFVKRGKEALSPATKQTTADSRSMFSNADTIKKEFDVASGDKHGWCGYFQKSRQRFQDVLHANIDKRKIMYSKTEEVPGDKIRLPDFGSYSSELFVRARPRPMSMYVSHDWERPPMRLLIGRYSKEISGWIIKILNESSKSHPKSLIIFCAKILNFV